MKTLYYLAMALLLAANLKADPVRYPWRTFSGANVDLQPLFSWWTFASETTNAPLDLTQIDPAKLEQISNLWSRLPARPLPDWFRIQAREDRITVVGSMWRLDALVEPAPMMIKHEIIYLQNPPVKEIQDFKQARDNYAALRSAQSADRAGAQYYMSNIQAEAASVQTNSPPATAVATPANAMLQRDSVLTASNLDETQARIQSRNAQISALDQYLAGFPNKTVYWLDHFALHTGKQIDGIDVYDLGTAQGLTY
jgi:hypothetical protein